MWNEIFGWWNSLWTDPRIFGAAIGGLVTGLILLLLGEMWRNRSAEMKWRKELSQARLNQVYGPLYKIYRSAYARFEVFKRLNPGTQVERQGFFEANDETTTGEILSQNPSHASQTLIEQWVAVSVAENREEQQRCRIIFVRTLIKEYQALRREIGLDYNRRELRTREFTWD